MYVMAIEYELTPLLKSTLVISFCLLEAIVGKAREIHDEVILPLAKDPDVIGAYQPLDQFLHGCQTWSLYSAARGAYGHGEPIIWED
jgi:hypothetical protein